MTTHDLKLNDKYFNAVKNGIKTFEIRNNDRGYQVGDILVLHLWADVGGISGYAKKTGATLADGKTELIDKVPEYLADKIVVKVTSIMTAEDYNSYEDSKKMSRFGQTHEVRCCGYWFKFSKIDKVLNEYFGKDSLPHGYVVMGIEVVEWNEC